MTTDVAEEYERTRVDAVGDRRTGRRAVDAAAVIREDAARAKRREVDAVVEKLQSRTDLTEADREALEAMAEGIVDRLVGTATRTLRDANDPGTLETALELFDPELEATTDGDTSAAAANVEDNDGN